jgi:Asp-tRNA(Asn)/Glu-tRNA(Gln) amidotransferase A subunit family amidase
LSRAPSDLTIAEASARIAARELSQIELTEAYLDRIGALDDRLHAFVRVTADEARAEAQAADAEIRQGHLRGPLHGIRSASRICSTRLASRRPAARGHT